MNVNKEYRRCYKAWKKDFYIKPFKQRCEHTKMGLKELKELFARFLWDSTDDVCQKCIFCEKETCVHSIFVINGDGDMVFPKPELYASDTCFEGLYEYYKKNNK